MRNIELLLENDRVETLLGKQVEDMEPFDLLCYVQEHFKHEFGYSMVVSNYRETSVIRWLRKTYGQDAGTILKWLFLKHRGRWDGEPFSFNLMGVKSKWRVDAIRNDMYNEINRERNYLKAQQESGLSSW